MRDLARSVMRCSWALTVLGARQTLGLAGARDRSASGALDAVTQAAEEQLDEMSRSVYRTGERLQGGLFDLVADLTAAGRAWSPARFLDRAAGRSSRPRAQEPAPDGTTGATASGGMED